MQRSFLLILFNTYAMFDLSLSNSDQAILQLSVYPTSGISTENIEVFCQITSPPYNYDNVYLSVKTDNVKPSGILLMADDTNNDCRINREKYIHVYMCNRTHIRIRINHTILNDSLHTIDYGCTKGETTARTSYRILNDQRIRHYDPKYQQLSASSSSASSLVSSWFFVVLLFFDDVRWSLIS